MDLAYDHIQEQALTQDKRAATNEDGSGPPQQESTLNADFQEAYKAISASPWGARLGGLWGSVVKQGESVYKEAQHEFTTVQEEATKGFTDLKASLTARASAPAATAQGTGGAQSDAAVKEAEGVLARLKIEAARRLKEIEKAEDAADEALLKFGTNVRNFLRDAVRIAPAEGEGEGVTSTVLFESKDAQGKRVIHTTRFDAQLHAVHCSLESFTKEPEGAEVDAWKETFNVESKTDAISKDLETFPELRKSMETLVPDKVTYVDFWRRYYFLRHSIETAEAKRKELLKGAAATEQEEIGWDEDSDDETPPKAKPNQELRRPASTESSMTIQPNTVAATMAATEATPPTPRKPRKSDDEKSRADSDASYDVVGAASGAPSQAPNSPKDAQKAAESDEEDWE